MDLLDAFLSTLDDARITRGERRALRALLADAPLTEHQRTTLQNKLIDAVRDRMHDPRDKELLEGLGQALNLLRPAEVHREEAKVLFGPEDPMVETLEGLLGAVRKTLDICVFTITDDRLSQRILDAQRRGVAVRIVTDDDKANDRGSDAWTLSDRGVPMRTDRSEHHMHHKFAVLDDHIVVTGSYNWTRSADAVNRENYVVSTDPVLVRAFGNAFDELWERLA